VPSMAPKGGLARAATSAGQVGIASFFGKKRVAEPDKDQENCEPVGEAGTVKRSKTVAVAVAAPASTLSVHEIYQKKTQLEHILLRPDSYVGSTEKQIQDHWIVNADSGRIERKKVEYVPALFKIFDEILVNAADNRIRCPSQDMLAVEINTAKGWVSVMNNGKGIPVEMHSEHKCYVPELIFGHLLTSDNFDDSEKKVVGGRNGYGAKLTNIFSTKFIVETADSKSKKHYKQVWEHNMSKCNKAEMKKNDAGDDFTKITFYPDFKRFQMTHLDDDVAGLFRRRVYDIGATMNGQCKVSLDGKELEASTFQEYVNLYVDPENFRINEKINERWEVAIGLTDGSGFQQVSFVNSINTSSGGTHVNYISDQVVNAILERTSKTRGSGLAIKAAHVKSYLWVFVNCLIENPAFNSQAKEVLTLKRDRFGSDCQLPPDFLNAILESGIVDRLLEWSKAMGKSELAQHLNRSDLSMQKRLFGVPKLDDANKAGTPESPHCTLILTEGDSAKALAVAGLSIVGRDHYGVFPLRGKLRNVRDLTDKQLRENREIDAIMKILALDINTEYRNTNGLRYGSIMIMTDQDYDGSHIKGLIINFIQHWFPSLMKIDGFMKEFVTPIVKVTRGDTVHTFFTMPEYENWKEANDNGAGWKSKYYKGLGTSTGKEAKEYFGDLENHELTFAYNGSEEDDLIDMAFNSKRADDRKRWISECEEGTFVDHSSPTLSYTDFIKKELVLFAKYDVQRAVPSLVDGLKPGQRKVLFGILKKRLGTDMKVAQLSGYIAEHSAYHHGETSLQGTIIAMAQNFVGSNNVNLLLPVGQFGTRLQGGKDHAASRYIHTKPSRALRAMFSEEDDAVLEYQNEEGMGIEPRWYCPVIPLVLVNGVEGIGTGWSTSIPNYNPREIIANLRHHLNGEEMQPLSPWYRGFKGTITPVPNTPGKFEVSGVAQTRGRVLLEITELPVRTWTQDYKEKLLDMLPQSGDEKRASVTEIREYHTENSVHFVLAMTPDKVAEAERKGFEKSFSLKSSVATTNMYLFDHEGNIQKYHTPEDIIKAFIPTRMEVYGKRKEHHVGKLEREVATISNRFKFVQMVITDQLDVERRKTNELCNEMHKKGLQTMSEILGGPPVKENGPDGYKYLLSMKMWSLTDDKVRALQDEREKKLKQLDVLKATTLEQLWEKDLQKLEAALDACDAEDRKEAEEAAKLIQKKMGSEDLLVNRQCVLVLTKSFEAKRVRASTWKAKKRGKKMDSRNLFQAKKSQKQGEGEEAKEGGEEAEKEEEEQDEGGVEDNTDGLSGVFCCYDFDALLVFSENGMVYKLQALDIPLAKSMRGKGVQLKEFLPELGDHAIAALVTIDQRALKDQSDEFVILVSKHGFAKKVALDKFRGLRAGKPLMAFNLKNDDKLQWAHRASCQSCLVMASAEGMVLRCSLGDDWRSTSGKSGGMCAFKVNPKVGDWVAASAISKLSDAELRQYHKNRKDAAEKRRAGVRAKLEGAGESAANGVTGVAPDGDEKPKKPGACDDDDSDNGMEVDAGGKPAAEAAGSDAEGDGDAEEKDSDGEKGDDADDKDDKDDKDDDDAEHPGEGTDEQCILLVTEQGMGIRMPLSGKRIKLMRRGGRGRRCIKLSCGRDPDNIVAVCPVSNRGEVKRPNKWREPWLIYHHELKAQKAEGEANNAAEGEAAAVLAAEPVAEPEPEAQPTEETQPAEGQEAPNFGGRTGFEEFHASREAFAALDDERKEELQQISDEERRVYDLECQEVSKMEAQEEILLGTDRGNICRITVGSVPIVSSLRKGKILVKLGKGDKVCTASLLSSVDEADDDGKPKAPAPGPSRAVRPRVGAKPAADGTDPSASSGAAKAAFRASPLKKLPSFKAASPAVEKLRSRLSHLARAPSRQALLGHSASKTRLSPSTSLRLSIVKPKLRLLSETKKKLHVRSLDVHQWAAFAAAAAANPNRR